MSGGSLHKHLYRSVVDIGFKPILDDQEKWMKPSVKLCGYKYYTYTTTWLDGGITIRNDPGNIIKVPKETYFIEGIKVILEGSLLPRRICRVI